MKRVREQSPMLSKDCGRSTQTCAEGEDSDLYIGFRTIEEVEDEMKKRRLASLDGIDRGLFSQNLNRPEKFITSRENRAPHALQRWPRSPDEVKPLHHVILSHLQEIMTK